MAKDFEAKADTIAAASAILKELFGARGYRLQQWEMAMWRETDSPTHLLPVDLKLTLKILKNFELHQRSEAEQRAQNAALMKGNVRAARNRYWFMLLYAWRSILRQPCTLTTDPITNEIRGAMYNFVALASEVVLPDPSERSPVAFKKFWLKRSRTIKQMPLGSI